MWEVGDIKIERTRAHYIVLCVHGYLQKSDFFGKTFSTRKFSTGKFLGPVLTEFLRTQDSENIVPLFGSYEWLKVRS